MKRRRVRWILVATASVLIALAIVLLWPPPESRPSRATFEQVRVGMTRAEVEATVGGPPGYYALGSDMSRRSFGEFLYDRWVCDECQLLVLFEEGRALEVHICEVLMVPRPSPWERFRGWAGL